MAIKNAKQSGGKDGMQEMHDAVRESIALMDDYIHQREESGQMNESEALFLGSMRSFQTMMANTLERPEDLIEAQMNLYQQQLILWNNSMARLLGQEVEPYNVVPHKDRRFRDEAWSKFMVFDYIRQSYTMLCDTVQNMVGGQDGLDDRTKQQIQFYTRQWLDALSPSNFIFTNPEVLRETMESGGENLRKGMENLLDDLADSRDFLNISMVDDDAFSVGENLAVTPGEVVFKNDLVELIQYAPATDEVYKNPIFIVSPWINKYYILDLQPHNSMVKWLVEQGHTVFITSWVNPGKQHAQLGMQDYMQQGILDCLDAISDITESKQINVVGYCIGGTLLSMTLAYLKATKKKAPIESASFFTTMLDFGSPGEMGVFIDDLYLEGLEETLEKTGVFDGEYMSMMFRSLRASDLIWSFVINNYLLGKSPFPFDLLYWNADKTAMPATMYREYIKSCYLDNKLATNGAWEFAGVKLDLSKIDVPTYAVACHEDHIAPWQSTYQMTQLFKGPLRYVLAESGHVAGVVNPPDKKKYGFYVGADSYPADPQAWLENATRSHESWWTDWDAWLAAHHAGEKIPAAKRKPGNAKYKSLSPAPGTYVKDRH